MRKRRLGSSTLEVSVVGLGGNNFGGRIDFAASQRVVHAAIDLGVNLIDTADAYGNRGGSEEWLGRILGPRRRKVVLATKFGLPMDADGRLAGASRRYVMQAVKPSRSFNEAAAQSAAEVNRALWKITAHFAPSMRPRRKAPRKS